ncbi:hypothetical protein TraAM80_09622 [Trypanosoma rangeli]|uniref:Uncharacterized protein n=1 Tax=Trypanosoma rangeli TaxID=5698 RepID=A0A422MUC3_TRYRA|nr:uncharacterized protein TraAM80_09622 [Trypanosoma rangeli]RNE96806.1 hypothetical protein TraAM80_09622 [Trypanosoma rangeli]|eukprot:RNE96806.1 hypothetical protein TraAM80_09622 [Trypanosoma rangeli]
MYVALAVLWVLLVCWLLLLSLCAAGGKEGGGAACGAMRGTSPALSCDSAEDIYNLLCAVQAQANADEEEVKTRRLCITNHERETDRAQEEARDLSEQHARACDELKGKRLRVEEQRLRHAGAVEHLSRTKQEVAEVMGALFECELPVHSAVEKGTPQEILSPAVLRSTTASLKQKIRVAMEQQRRRVKSCSALPPQQHTRRIRPMKRATTRVTPSLCAFAVSRCQLQHRRHFPPTTLQLAPNSQAKGEICFRRCVRGEKWSHLTILNWKCTRRRIHHHLLPPLYCRGRSLLIWRRKRLPLTVY